MESKIILIKKEAEKITDRIDFQYRRQNDQKKGMNKLDISLDLFDNIIRIIKKSISKKLLMNWKHVGEFWTISIDLKFEESLFIYRE